MKHTSRWALLAGVCVAGTSLAAGTPAADPGVWQKHQYSFQYLGFTSTYSCDGLADQLQRLLIAAGARPDAKAQPGACSSGFGRPDKFARAELTFYSLVPTGPTAPPAGAEGPPVEGAWRPSTLAQHSPHELKLGDCELIEQFRTSVLPLFTTRNVENRTSCIPYQLSGSVIDLKFDAFVAAKGAAKGGAAVSPPTAGVASAK